MGDICNQTPEEREKFIEMIKDKPRTYAVHSIFITVQGEGANAGRLAVFVRFSGCSVWSGREEDRERDSAKSACARICDTKFRGIDESKGGGRYTAKELAIKMVETWEGAAGRANGKPFVVFTGGEPALQVDEEICGRLKTYWETAIETSGTVPLKAQLDWVTLSPKPPAGDPEDASWLKVTYCDELKVLYPLFNPLWYEGRIAIPERSRKWVQPVDNGQNYAQSGKNAAAIEACFEFVKKHPDWRISVQGHKLLGMP